MNVTFTPLAWEDYQYWQQNDKRVIKRIHLLIKDIDRSPFDGIGKPEALRHNLSDYWSRRITDEHRMVYQHGADGLILFQLRYHYAK
ncbi:MAG: Txe/YoeB family addiction module toxin [Puniceicoccales bacterium]